MLSEQANVPLIAYRCRAEELGLGDGSIAMDRFVIMVYSLTRQLVWLLPETVNTTHEFSVRRFSALDATSHTLLDALNLLEDFALVLLNFHLDLYPHSEPTLELLLKTALSLGTTLSCN